MFIRITVLLIALLATGASFCYASSLGAPPPTVDEAVATLKKCLPPTVLNDLKSSQKNQLSRFNTSIGSEIRNTWFWGYGKSPLADFFVNQGIRNPDHMSAALLAALWSDLHNQPRDLAQLLSIHKLEEFRAQNFVKETIVIPKKLASIELTTTKGKKISLAQQRGYVLILSFLSTGPGTPSNIEFLNSSIKKYGKKLRVIGIFANDDNSDQKKAAAYKLAKFPMVEKWPGRYLKELSLVLYAPWVRSVPSNVIIDKSGQMVWRTGEWTDTTIERTKQELKEVMKRESQKRPPGSD